MKFSVVKAFVVSCLLAGAVFGQDQVQAIPADSVKTANADIKVEVDGKATLNESFEQYAKNANIEYGKPTSDGRFYSKGYVAVAIDVNSPQFVKSRAMAYERAYLNALAKFIMDAYGSTASETISEYYGNVSSDVNESPVEKAKSLTEKVALLTEAKLDKALAEEGVPADKYSQASVVEKRKIFQDAIAKKTMNKVLHMSSGCIPVKTFETWGSDNRYYIGVIVRYDRVSKTLAMCFKNKIRPALTKDGGMTIAEALPPKDEMLGNFGVRLFFDENGTPALLSFGQFGSSYRGNNVARAERAESQAMNQARSLADAGLTSFINSWIDASEESILSEDISESTLFMDDGTARPEEAQKVVDIYRKSIKQYGRDTMKGRSTVFEEVLTHKNGHKVAVVVRCWSFGTVDAVDVLDKVVEEKKPQPSPVKTIKPGINAGRTYDF
ncbi:MAG: hypothetical protein J6V88_04455 [Kiritimatiellae bacterium]|nr:hypothetical protein [Kiritimatiellia bacterium]